MRIPRNLNRLQIDFQLTYNFGLYGMWYKVVQHLRMAFYSVIILEVYEVIVLLLTFSFFLFVSVIVD